MCDARSHRGAYGVSAARAAAFLAVVGRIDDIFPHSTVEVAFGRLRSIYEVATRRVRLRFTPASALGMPGF